MWSRYASRRRELSYRDAYSLAGCSVEVAEALEAKAKRTGLTVAAVRSRASRVEVDLPQDRTQHTDTLLKKLVMAKRNVLMVADAIKAGPHCATEAALRRRPKGYRERGLRDRAGCPRDRQRIASVEGCQVKPGTATATLP
jgi:hypothetical protein